MLSKEPRALRDTGAGVDSGISEQIAVRIRERDGGRAEMKVGEPVEEDEGPIRVQRRYG